MEIWIISIVLAFVVTGVVGLLLWMILSKAKQINDGVSQIWDVGQMIAANTIHVPALITTNAVAGAIIAKAPVLLEELEKIETHAVSCENCPNCLES
jgi:hypothetical protein